MIRILSTFAALLLTIGIASAQEVKNIIYLIGDGMGLSSVSMMQVKNGYNPTIFDQAENVALQKTYSADNRVTDSAASGTALATGYKTNNTYIGAALYKNRGRFIHYGFDGNICLVGYKLGEFQVNGHLDAGFKLGKDSMTLAAMAYVKNETPDYYLQHYRSNHYQWDNEFSKTYRFYVGGEVAYPTQWVKPRLRVSFENVTNHIYFDQQGLPQQHTGNIQVLAADLQLNITTPWVNLDNSVVYQHSSSAYIPLPALTLYNNLYYHGTWVKALDVQIGVDMRLFTKYYAPVLNPALGQFCVQQVEKVGNYPVMNVYANFYVKHIRLKLFAQYQHFNASFMNKQYFAMPGYPMAPDMFRAGLSWHFYK